jgi:poly(3-hydroxyalkanoate) synthetase
MSTRSGDKVEAAANPGNAEFPPIEPAPGSYVFNK